jgi:hypothetical protein
MADQRGWPDPTNPGVPMNPDQAGPHLIRDEHGRRRWFWWRPANVPSDGSWSDERVQVPAIYVGERWTYIGPAKTPDGRPVD